MDERVLKSGELLSVPPLGELRLRERLGEGRRSVVWAVARGERELALKVYRPQALARHAARHGESLPSFEFHRCRAFHAALPEYVAEPLAFAVEPVPCFVQERLVGRLYGDLFAETGAELPGVLAQLRRLVDRAHAAGLFDVDLDAFNVMVVEGPGGEPWPKLFDFNLLPWTLRAQNPLYGLLLRLGLLSPERRDLRRLRRFHDRRRLAAIRARLERPES